MLVKTPKEKIEAVETAETIYGRLLEGMYTAGHSLERALTNTVWLLTDGRWRTVGGGFNNPHAFLESTKPFKEFNLVADQRKQIRKLLQEAEPTISNRAVAAAMGVSETQVRRDTATNVARKGKKAETNQPDTATFVAPPSTTGIGGAAAANLAQNRVERKRRDVAAEQTRIKHALQSADGSVGLEIRCGDFSKDVFADLHDVDAIITDPPYGEEYLPLLPHLAAFADRVLKPDGIMAILYGKTHLPEAFRMLSGFRPYRWTACYLEKGAGYVSMARAVQSNWKPILVYGGNAPRFADLFESDGDAAAKERHKWGQNFQTFQTIIERLTVKGAMVVDPFMGSGATLLAAKSIGRHSKGCDIDPDVYDAAEKFLFDQ